MVYRPEIVTTFAPTEDQQRAARLLVHSVAERMPRHGLTVWLPEDRRDEYDSALRTEMGDRSDLIWGETPDPEWRKAEKHQALIDATERTERDWVALLDVDTVLLGDIGIGESVRASACLKPVDIGETYWGRESSFDDWLKLYSHFPVKFPGVQTRSTVDLKPIPPFYNGGVVFCRSNTKFPEKWRDWTAEARKLFSRDMLPWGEQEVLGVLSQKYTVEEIGEQLNYPLPHRTAVADGTIILHHHFDFDRLDRMGVL